MNTKLKAAIERLRFEFDGKRWPASRAGKQAADILAVCAAAEQADQHAAACKEQWDAWQATAYKHEQRISELQRELAEAQRKDHP